MANTRDAILLGTQGAANLAGGLMQMFGYKSPEEQAMLEAQDNASKYFEASMSNDPAIQQSAWKYRLAEAKALAPHFGKPGVRELHNTLAQQMDTANKEWTDFINNATHLSTNLGMEVATNPPDPENYTIKQIFGNKVLAARPYAQPTEEDFMQTGNKYGLPAFATPQAEEDYRYKGATNKALYGGLENTPLQPFHPPFQGEISDLQAFPEKREVAPLGGKDLTLRQLRARANQLITMAEKMKDPKWKAMYEKEANDLLSKAADEEVSPMDFSMFGGGGGLMGQGQQQKRPQSLLAQVGFPDRDEPGPTISGGAGGLRVSQSPSQPNPQHKDKQYAWQAITGGGFDPQTEQRYPLPSSVQDALALSYGIDQANTKGEIDAAAGFINTLGMLKIVEDNILEGSKDENGNVQYRKGNVPNYTKGLGWEGFINSWRNNLSFNKWGLASQLFGDSDPNFVSTKSLADLINDNFTRARTGAAGSFPEFESLRQMLLGALDSGDPVQIWTRLQQAKKRMQELATTYFKGIQNTKYLPSEYRFVNKQLGIKDSYPTSEYDNVDKDRLLNILTPAQEVKIPSTPRVSLPPPKSAYMKSLEAVRSDPEWGKKSKEEQREEAYKRAIESGDLGE